MQSGNEIKQALYAVCIKHVDDRIRNIKEAIELAKDGADDQVKSSAGDKHETARALMQIEQEKSAKLLAETQKLKQVLSQINIQEIPKAVKLGSVVICGEINFFICISIGKIKMNNHDFFAIAPNTPIGKTIAGLKQGNSFNFNGKELTIKELH